MDQKTATALSERLSPHVSLGKDRRETLALLTVCMLSARTANLWMRGRRLTRSAALLCDALVEACAAPG